MNKGALRRWIQRELDIMLARVGQVIRQTKARVFEGNTHMSPDGNTSPRSAPGVA